MTGEATAAGRPIYEDIARRTGGDLYIGVVGPVRTGKSTFIARFMEKLVLPLMESDQRLDRVRDELPQSGAGRTIMTVQPQFVPGEGAAKVELKDGASARIRMADSPGYLIPGALGAQEGGEARMVSTPWSDEDMPFEAAAALGTRKVIEDHATVGVVVTTDGTITDLPRENYIAAEEKVVRELRALNKPFAIVLNSARPREAEKLAQQLREKYDAPVSALSVKDMEMEEIREVLYDLLSAFPLRSARFSLPDWLSALPDDHWLVRHVIDRVREAGDSLRVMRDAKRLQEVFASSEFIAPPQNISSSPGEGALACALPLREGLFNKVLSEECGACITGDAHLLRLMKSLVAAKEGYDRVSDALAAAGSTGYGLVTPAMSDIALDRPEITRQGSRYGVRLRATAPTLHLIRSDIETEIAPVLGTEEQSGEFVKFLLEKYDSDPASLWDTNFFGKSLQELIREGLSAKLGRMPADAQEKVQTALTRMLNEGSGGMVCILL